MHGALWHSIINIHMAIRSECGGVARCWGHAHVADKWSLLPLAGVGPRRGVGGRGTVLETYSSTWRPEAFGVRFTSL